MTFQYLTVSCIPATYHVYDISIPDSFMYGSCSYMTIQYLKNYVYLLIVMYMTFQYLTVSCIGTHCSE